MIFPIETLVLIPITCLSFGVIRSSKALISLGMALLPAGVCFVFIDHDILVSLRIMAFLGLLSFCSGLLCWEYLSRRDVLLLIKNKKPPRRTDVSDMEVQFETVAERLKKIETLKSRQSMQRPGSMSRMK